ncbi:hypothetical protein AB0I81_23530 [Nonomuraea sp. NPDC050404]|uniref:hypothetical protein n=1 Tax=Nonomuraea sp. NPDC050404 TaxID=3155783 RepID=UPI003409F8A9
MTSHAGTRLALLLIAAAQLLMVVDGTIVTVGLPVIGTGLGVPETGLDWVLTTFAPLRGALTSGYTTGMLGAGGFYPAAIVTAVLRLRPSNRDGEPTPETLGSN